MQTLERSLEDYVKVRGWLGAACPGRLQSLLHL